MKMIILFLHLDLAMFILGCYYFSTYLSILLLDVLMVQHLLCYSLSDTGIFPFYPDKNPVGFREILQRYKEITPGIQMSGPTNFAPLINKAIEIVRDSKAVCFLFLYFIYLFISFICACISIIFLLLSRMDKLLMKRIPSNRLWLHLAIHFLSYVLELEMDHGMK